MTEGISEPAHWSDGRQPDGTTERIAGAAFRHVREATEPTDAALARVARRRREGRRRTPLIARVARVALGAAVIMSMAGAVGAAVSYWRRHAAPTPPSVTTPVATPRVRPRVPNAIATSEAPAEPALVEPPPAEAPRAHELPAWPRTRRGPRVVVPSDESEVLGAAFRALRTNGDPAAALRALDEYDRRFGAGTMRGEARIARAEALIAQNRRAVALPILAALGDDEAALTRGVRATRGELYAEADRCHEAVRDFEHVLTGAADDAIGGRALYGRAACRLRAGEVAGARIDLESYLSLHAEGAFAAAARRALESLP